MKRKRGRVKSELENPQPFSVILKGWGPYQRSECLRLTNRDQSKEIAENALILPGTESPSLPAAAQPRLVRVNRSRI
jgi:hypothetical protein